MRRPHQPGQRRRMRMQPAARCRQHYLGVSQPQHPPARRSAVAQPGGPQLGQPPRAGHHRNPQRKRPRVNRIGPRPPARRPVARPGVRHRRDAIPQQPLPQPPQRCPETAAVIVPRRPDPFPQPPAHLQQQPGRLPGPVPRDDAPCRRRRIPPDACRPQPGPVQYAGVAGTMLHPHRTPP